MYSIILFKYFYEKTVNSVELFTHLMIGRIIIFICISVYCKQQREIGDIKY